ncbi:NAD(P)-binding protein [Xylona heveae TC161]|uniref:NAD(P)-binding protein n=1 Tax=Xylona heveae (strain CBS 132557 / TC161) TaxID=1328760 RepID=A0A165ISZ3_XYLHT|nr:NAD(P)-binding protein [Xylona heveae TC161]KZF25342.1 NAD(P)-binding protein [Xylona heveae TC161]
MSPKIILITGINGYLASNTGTAVLQAGHILRGTCRSHERVKALLEGPWNQYQSQIEISIVPDISEVHAFDEAVKGVSAIIHMAAPVISPEISKASTQLIEPTIAGTRNLLNSALNYAGDQLEIFVFTSSAAACIKPGAKAPHVYDDDSWNVVHPEIVERDGDNVSIFTSYPVAKIKAEKYVWSLYESKAPFAIASICGSIATGPPIVLPESESEIPSTCKSVLNALRGLDLPGPQSHIANIAGAAPYSDIRDLAKIYLWCTENPQIADGQRYLVVAGHGPQKAMYDILKEAYPERAHMIPNGDEFLRYNKDWTFDEDGVRFDSRKVQKHVGLTFKTYKQTILDTAEVLAPYWKHGLPIVH